MSFVDSPVYTVQGADLYVAAIAYLTDCGTPTHEAKGFALFACETILTDQPVDLADKILLHLPSLLRRHREDDRLAELVEYYREQIVDAQRRRWAPIWSEMRNSGASPERVISDRGHELVELYRADDSVVWACDTCAVGRSADYLGGVDGAISWHHDVLDAVTPPAYWFESTAEAYDASQTSDDIAPGDLLVVPSENVVGVLYVAWPIAVTEAWGAFDGSVSDESASIWTGMYADSFRRAVAVAEQIERGRQDAPDP